LGETKSALRDRMRKARGAVVGKQRLSAAREAGERLSDVLAELGAGLVAGFRARGTEIDVSDTWQHLLRRGVVLAWPRVVTSPNPDALNDAGDTGDAYDPRLAFHLWPPSGPWVRGRFGIEEPPARAPCIPACALDVVIAPGLAFDAGGGRLGYGGGYYDRVAREVSMAGRGIVVGLAFACQMIDHVPQQPHDMRVHRVVTERAVYHQSEPAEGAR